MAGDGHDRAHHELHGRDRDEWIARSPHRFGPHLDHLDRFDVDHNDNLDHDG